MEVPGFGSRGFLAWGAALPNLVGFFALTHSQDMLGLGFTLSQFGQAGRGFDSHTRKAGMAHDVRHCYWDMPGHQPLN